MVLRENKSQSYVHICMYVYHSQYQVIDYCKRSINL